MVALLNPVTSAVEGVAAGAGAGLVLASAHVVETEDERFVCSGGRVGLSPVSGSACRAGWP